MGAGGGGIGHDGGVPAPAPLPPTAATELLDVLGPTGYVTDPDVVAGHAIDWTGRFRGHAPAVARPADAGEVAGVVDVARRHGLALVPQGGNTGLVGGSVPMAGELVLSLRRLDAVGEVDLLAGQITVGAGAVLADVQAAAAACGLAVPVDLGARASATVGGMAATNAGGLHLVRWGPMRHHVLGHEAVLGDGRTLRHLAGLPKDNTGYDLGSLLCGSEGTLGVFTTLRLGLVPVDAERATALVAFSALTDAVAAVASWRRSLHGLEAAEAFTGDGLGLVLTSVGGRDPFPERHAWYVLVEVAGPADPTSELADAVAAAPGVADVAVAGDPSARRALWALREEHTPAINALGPPHKLDVTLPLPVLAEVVDRLPGEVARLAPSARTWLFGHLGDGNVHVNVTGIALDDVAVDDLVLRTIAAAGGSISAEHGIGVAKKRWLHLNRSADELAAFRSVKAALDPDGVLNPNVLL